MNSDPRQDSNELSPAAREGVDKMRTTPAPSGLEERSLEMVRRKEQGAGRARRRALLAVAVLAAVLLGGVLYRNSRTGEEARDSLQAKNRDRPGSVPPVGGKIPAAGWDGGPIDPSSNEASRKTDPIKDRAPQTEPTVTSGRENDWANRMLKKNFQTPSRPQKDSPGDNEPRPERAFEKPSRTATPPAEFPQPAREGRTGEPEETARARYERLLKNSRTPGAMSQEELGEARRHYLRTRIERLKALSASGSIEQQVVDETITQYESEFGALSGAASKGIQDKNRGKPKPGPQVWKQDRRQPTFARVYVGDGNALELVSLHVSVTVEGPRARTLVDHVFRNPHGRQLEGTFEYPLPSGASPSYFAMFLGRTRDTVPPRFVRRGQTPPLPQEDLARLTPEQFVKHVSTDDWGPLQEARVVSKQKALETYEDTVRGQIDPALLEYAGGNTFRGRVFPIPPKGYNRVLIAYEELLPVSGGRSVYRFPLPDGKLTDLQLTLQANPHDCQEPTFLPAKADKRAGKHLLSYSHSWKEKGPGGSVLFSFTPPQPQVQAISGRQGDNGPTYLYTRLRPELNAAKAAPFAEHAVFLLDASLSESPRRFDISIKLLRKILEGDASIKRFNVLTFNVGAAWIQPGWTDNTAAGRARVLKLLDGLVLEGATDFSAALDKVVKPGFRLTEGTPLNVFVLSDGQITWGEADVNPLVARFEKTCPYPTRFHCYRTGLGADNLELFQALTRRGGGIFNCFGEADLTAAAGAHRQHCWQINSVALVDGPPARDLLIAGRRAAVYPGGELVVAARLDRPGRITLQVEGTFLGKPLTRRYTIDAGGDSELAPRGWAEIAVAEMLALNDPRLDSLVTAYCQQFGIASRVASFLVLENDNDYKRLNLQQERGKAVPGDMGEFLAKAWLQIARVLSPREALNSFLARVNPRVRVLDGDNGQVARMLALLSDRDFELPREALDGALTRREDVPSGFEKELLEKRREVGIYVKEARRRLRAGDTTGAVRVLSSIVEEHPGRGDALRLVGYRLLDLRQFGQAVRLFEQVQRSRPFEPHSYRDLARSLEECGKYGLAAVQYEVVLAGTWHGRFGEALKLVAREEYARMLREALNRKAVTGNLADHFAVRLAQLSSNEEKSDLRVTITWNTDATDVDLWVIEPDGTKCFYSNNRTQNGGELTQDQTQGYGPERYRIKDAPRGEFRVLVHYYRPNANLISGETHVNVVITRFAGSPQEVTERRTVILKKHDEAVEVIRVKF